MGISLAFTSRPPLSLPPLSHILVILDFTSSFSLPLFDALRISICFRALPPLIYSPINTPRQIVKKWNNLHWVYYPWCRRCPAAADRESPRRKSTDTRVCRRWSCAPLLAWRPAAWIHLLPAAWYCPSRSTGPGSCSRSRCSLAGSAICHRDVRPSAPVRQSFVASSRAEADHRQRRRPAGSRHCVLWEEEEEKEIQYHFVFLGLLRGRDWEMRMFFWLRGSPTKVWLLLWGPKNQIMPEQQDKYFSVKIESATTRDCSVDVKVLVCGAFKFPSDGWNSTPDLGQGRSNWLTDWLANCSRLDCAFCGGLLSASLIPVKPFHLQSVNTILRLWALPFRYSLSLPISMEVWSCYGTCFNLIN